RINNKFSDFKLGYDAGRGAILDVRTPGNEKPELGTVCSLTGKSGVSFSSPSMKRTHVYSGGVGLKSDRCFGQHGLIRGGEAKPINRPISAIRRSFKFGIWSVRQVFYIVSCETKLHVN